MSIDFKCFAVFTTNKEYLFKKSELGEAVKGTSPSAIALVYKDNLNLHHNTRATHIAELNGHSFRVFCVVNISYVGDRSMTHLY